MKRLTLGLVVVIALLYGWRFVAAQEEAQSFALACTIVGREVTCTGSLPPPSASPTSLISSPSATASTTGTATPSPSPITPTATASATRTSTRTPTPTVPPPATVTPTPTGASGYTVDQLISDTTGNHHGTLCTGSPPGGVSGFDWQFRGRVNDAAGPSQFTSWGTVQWRGCGASVANTVVEIRNLRVYAYTGSWQLYPSQNNPFNWCGDHYPDTTAYVTACTRVGNGWRMPTGARSIHWAESTDSVFANDQCHAVFFEMRKIGAGEVMANTGFDWRNGNSSAGDSWFGSYRALTADWKAIGGSSCPASLLRANPPPLP